MAPRSLYVISDGALRCTALLPPRDQLIPLLATLPLHRDACGTPSRQRARKRQGTIVDDMFIE